MSQFDTTIVPVWQRGYRFQYEPSQQAYIILYPEGMIKLNETASAIAQHIDGKRSVAEIILQLKQQFGDISEIDKDVTDYMLVAEKENWIKLSHG
ncbi:pyrroloquinoline quinone biosynthesis peptide chaperone PqqD [Acinetobacter rathckeae]|uniref:pyrroloquinoline quinone biosynthesis peptide chaperone PqqD n=1 Tax=Acinetobacter rathckeae TaxID=2605272 RepID=UPI0018A2B2A5|nr:pyrroloquinoline quinone biosynthesis peptide chaperone PqqD [Acinetobacter rathckeae]MBF7687123.1 pyrroloquinoline quinone biosynthesis peptide chaperone PqqD [Acinetobacter rathckeae]MBF7694525.1 pyrroloquinoline quinone biosynthesis peptide chaperone PqqD [Acinetobacter rathckeae]